MNKRRLDISNYEEWFIDHLDGTLNAEEELELEAFLLVHPELAVELEALDEVQLEARDIAFPDRSALLIPSEEELKLMLIAEEGGLAEMQSLGSAERKEVQALRRSILAPDMTLVYPHKEELLQEESSPLIIPLWIMRVAVAASVVGVILAILLGSQEATYVPREGLSGIEDEIGVEEFFQADYAEYAYRDEEEVPPAPDHIPQVIEYAIPPDRPSPQPLIAQEDAPPSRPVEPSTEVEEYASTEPPQQDPEDETDQLAVPALSEAQPLLVEEPEVKEEAAPQEENSFAMALAPTAPSRAEARGNREYNSVMDFLKSKAIETAEDKALLAMDGGSKEDRFVRTTLRIGGIEFSRLKRRKK